MSELAKARLLQLDTSNKPVKEGEVVVQFNPESLKVTFTNNVAATAQGDPNGTHAMRFVGAGTSKLTAQLWFDVTQQGSTQTDVRRLTKAVAFFMTPQEKDKDKTKTFVVPVVRFEWGTFQYDGVMEQMDETLELFSMEGQPLRASVNVTIAQQKITAFAFAEGSNVSEDFAKRIPRSAAGTVAGVSAPEGASLQSIAAGVPGAGDWQSIAAANGIENPRLLAAGQRIELRS